MNWISLLIGLVLLFAGRRLFWLFVAMVGFASSYHFAQQIGGIHSPLLVLVLSIAAGAVGAVIAIFFQKAAIVMAGFATGGYIAMILFGQLGGLPPQMVWLPYGIGGIIGAVFLFFVFDWALIFLSVITGAGIIINQLELDPVSVQFVYIMLVLVGFGFQLFLMRRNS